MIVNTKINTETVLLALFFVITFIFCRSDVEYDSSLIVRQVEYVQELWLLFCAAAILCMTKPFQRPKNERLFWLWSSAWWLLLYGRSISWGTVYLPEMSDVVHRLSSVIFIALVIVPFGLSTVLRREIFRQMRSMTVSLWSVGLTLLGFFVADTIEHQRILSPLFISDVFPDELAEELYEILFMVGLFSSTKALIFAIDESVPGYRVNNYRV